MAGNLDRDELIRLLERLGSESDAEALAAAREIDAKVAQAGPGWDALLVGEEGAEAEPDAEAEPEAVPAEEPEAEPEPPPGAGVMSDEEALRLIDELLAKKDLLDETRQELRLSKEDLGRGEFDAAERRYLRALHQRLSKRR